MTTAAEKLPPAPLVHMVPTGSIKPSPSNPRKNFADVDELAEDLKVRGILQPVLLRPRKKVTDNGRSEVDDGYELVFGERRWRAAKKAGFEQVPAFVRELGDQEALELQIVENAKRTDIHPVEEAEAYRELHEKHKLSVDEIAAKVGKSKAHVYGRIKLCELAESVKKAALAGELPATHALLIARIPTSLQAEALKEILGRDEPMSYRDAAEFVHRRFMLRLDQAPFDRADEKLVAAAGSCVKCPKRTGNQRELFSDVKSADVCTDPVCYRGKVAAAAEVKLKVVEEKGKEILRGAKAEKLFQEDYGGNHILRHGSGFVPLEGGSQYVPDRGYMDVKGAVAKDSSIKTVVVAHPDTGKPVELVPVKALPKPKQRGTTDYQALNKKREEKAEKSKAFAFSVIGPLVKRAEKGLGKPELTALVKVLLDEREYEGAADLVERRAGKELSYTQEQKGVDELSKSLPKKSEAELRGLLFELAVLGRDCFELLGKGEGNLAVAATALGVNVAGAKTAFEAAGKAPAPSGTACAIPGCGEKGKRVKGSPGLWCESHGKKLSATERKSIAERGKRLAAQAKKK